MKIINKWCLLIILISGLAGVNAFAGTVTVKGSTTVLPIAQACAEEFMNENTGTDISVQGGGSGAGIAALLDATTDIADASRPIKDEELNKAVSRGIIPRAHVVARDGIAVIVNLSNSIAGLTQGELKDIYTGKISSWSSLGGGSDKIVVISRDSASGTFETFNELALDKAKVRPDALLQASNNAVVSAVAKTPGAIGYVGLGYVTPQVKAVPIDGVKPTKETVLSGQYSLSRSLFMYTNGEPQGETRAFIDFVLSATGQKIAEENGYIGLK